MALSYPIAREILTDVEKERIVCTYLNATDTNAIEWDKAASDYGSASVESYKKGVQNTIKKIRKAMDEGGVAPAEGSSSTPAKAANKGGRKRKEKATSAVVESEGEEAVVEEEAPPKKKAKAKAAPKKSKAALKKEAEAAAAAAEAEDDEVVKSEVDDAE